MDSSDWRHQWSQRTLPELQNFSIVVLYALPTLTIFHSIPTFFRLRSLQKDLRDDPSSRSTILATREQILLKFSKRQFKVSLVYTILAATIWGADAFLGGYEIYDDVANNGTQYPQGFWLELAIRVMGMISILIATMIAVPMVQIVGFALWMQKKIRSASSSQGADGRILIPSAVLLDIIPEARTIACYMMHLWSIAFFCIAAVWSPISKDFVMRSIILQGVVGSANAWTHASLGLIWKAEKFKDELMGAQDVPAVGARGMTEKCLGGMKSIYVDEKQPLLPK